MSTVLVTGARGFIGRSLVAQLATAGHAVRMPAREARLDEWHDAPWTDALSGVDVVIHLAARAHVMREQSADPFTAFRTINVDGTSQLARAAARAGVRRLLFVSTIGVLGNETHDEPLSDASPPSPRGPYAISKHEAELALQDVCAASDLEYVTLRPPLVVGAGAPGNLARLLRLADSALPLPLATVRNQRSYVGVRDLCVVLMNCMTGAANRNKVYVVADPERLSTPELISIMRRRMGRPERLVPFPPRLLRRIARCAGLDAEAERLLGSLVVDASRMARVAYPSHPVGLRREIEAMVDGYRAGRPG